MTKIQMTIYKPNLVNGYTNTSVYKAIKTLPFGVEAGAFPVDGGKFIVEIKGRRSEIALNAAAAFVTAYSGQILKATQTNGKKVYDIEL